MELVSIEDASQTPEPRLLHIGTHDPALRRTTPARPVHHIGHTQTEDRWLCGIPREPEAEDRLHPAPAEPPKLCAECVRLFRLRRRKG